MARIPLTLAAAILLSACGTKGHFSSVVTDGLTGEPVDSLRLLARAQQTDDMTCKVLEGATNATGAATIQNSCQGVTYDLEAGDSTWLLVGEVSFEGGTPTSDVPLKAWRTPDGRGVYVLEDGALSPVRTASDMSSLPLWSKEEKVRYPDGVPRRVTKIEAGQHLLIVGTDEINRLEWIPLIKHEKALRFGSKAHFFDMDPWWYAGIRFQSKTEYEKVEANLDKAGVIDVKQGDRQVRYLAQNALAEGRYVLVGTDDRRAYIIDF